MPGVSERPPYIYEFAAMAGGFRKDELAAVVEQRCCDLAHCFAGDVITKEGALEDDVNDATRCVGVCLLRG